MLGLSRKKDKEEDIEEEVQPKPKRKPKKKPDPLKPWGKKERILIFLVLSVTVLSAIAFTLFSRDSLSKPVINIPSINFSQNETIVLEKPDTKALSREEMKRQLSSKISTLSGTYGVEVIELSTGKNYGINQNQKFEGASFFKFPLMLAVYRQAEKGKIDLSSTHILHDSEKVGGSGVLVGLPDGTAISIKDLVSYMGKDSDNTAFNILGNQIGWKYIDEIINDAGMQNTSFKDSLTTPYDMGILFQKFMEDKLVSSTSKKEILDFLTNTDNENLISKGVDSGIRVAHKYGRLTGVVNDGGVIFTTNPYILVIMTKGISEDEANKSFPELSHIVFTAEK